MRLANHWYLLYFAVTACSHPAKPPGAVVPKDSVDKSGYYTGSKKTDNNDPDREHHAG